MIPSVSQFGIDNVVSPFIAKLLYKFDTGYAFPSATYHSVYWHEEGIWKRGVTDEELRKECGEG